MVGIALALCASTTAPAITISVTYTGFTTAEELVLDQAKGYWESQVISSESFTVTAQKTALGPGLLGLATNYITSAGAPAGGTIQIDSGTAFFVDSTPADNVEYIQDPVTPNFFTADPSDPVVLGSYDLLSVGIHEFGHILGFTSNFSQFQSHIQPSADSLQNVFVFAGTPTLGDPATLYLANLPTNNLPFGGAYMPLNDPANEEAGGAMGIPSHLDNQNLGGASAGLFPMDAMNPGLGLGERRLISIPDLDILADTYGYTVVPEPSTFLLLTGGLAGLALLRRRA